MQRCSDSLKHCKVSLQVGMVFEDGAPDDFYLIIYLITVGNNANKNTKQ